MQKTKESVLLKYQENMQIQSPGESSLIPKL